MVQSKKLNNREMKYYRLTPIVYMAFSSDFRGVKVIVNESVIIINKAYLLDDMQEISQDEFNLAISETHQAINERLRRLKSKHFKTEKA